MRGQGKTEAQFLWTTVFLALAGVLLAGCLPGEDRREIDLDDRASDAELRELTARTDTGVAVFHFHVPPAQNQDARDPCRLLTDLLLDMVKDRLGRSGRVGKAVKGIFEGQADSYDLILEQNRVKFGIGKYRLALSRFVTGGRITDPP